MSKRTCKLSDRGKRERPVKCDPLHALAANLQDLAVQASRDVTRDVDSIVMSGERDINRIEHLLDHMLGFCFHDKMLFEFKRLCRYLYAIDPQAAVDYVHAYREMWENDVSKPGNANLPIGVSREERADLEICVPKVEKIAQFKTGQSGREEKSQPATGQLQFSQSTTAKLPYSQIIQSMTGKFQPFAGWAGEVGNE